MGFPGSSVGKESAFNAGEPSWIPESGRSSGEGIGYSPVFLSFTCGSAGKESTCNAGDLGSIPGLGRCPGEGKGYTLQYSGLENSMDCIIFRTLCTLSDSMDCSPARLLCPWGFSKEGILEWVAMSFCRGSSQSRDRTQVSHIAGGFFTT